MKRLFLITAALVASLFTLQAQTWVRFGTDNTSSGLPSDEVYDLEFDGQGTLWTATNKGVALLKGGVWTMLQGMGSLEGKAVNQLFLDKNKNMWLAATAEGIGMGWVSFYEEDFLANFVGCVGACRPVAWLCIGPVTHLEEVPDLVRFGWNKGRPLEAAVHSERL